LWFRACFRCMDLIALRGSLSVLVSVAAIGLFLNQLFLLALSLEEDLVFRGYGEESLGIFMMSGGAVAILTLFQVAKAYGSWRAQLLETLELNANERGVSRHEWITTLGLLIGLGQAGLVFLALANSMPMRLFAQFLALFFATFCASFLQLWLAVVLR